MFFTLWFWIFLHSNCLNAFWASLTFQAYDPNTAYKEEAAMTARLKAKLRTLNNQLIMQERVVSEYEQKLCIRQWCTEDHQQYQDMLVYLNTRTFYCTVDKLKGLVT